MVYTMHYTMDGVEGMMAPHPLVAVAVVVVIVVANMTFVNAIPYIEQFNVLTQY